MHSWRALQTVHGVGFVPVARVGETVLALDTRWFEARSWAVMATVACAAVFSSGVTAPDSSLSLHALAGPIMVLSVLLTSLGHELGHAAATRLQGLPVKAIVVAPQGGLTIRGAGHAPRADLIAALGGPAANALLCLACVIPVLALHPVGFVQQTLVQVALLQAGTTLINLLPWGPLDGRRIFAAYRAATREV
ncbi:MAG: hypothetical protein NVSMB2_09770 [Chloroflexota bacterium]